MGAKNGVPGKIMDVEFERCTIRIIDELSLKYVPVIFSWVEWTIALSVLVFCAEKTNSTGIRLLSALLGWALYLYYQAFFYSLDFVKQVRKGKALLFSLVLAGGVAFAAYSTSNEIARAIARIQMQ